MINLTFHYTLSRMYALDCETFNIISGIMGGNIMRYPNGRQTRRNLLQGKQKPPVHYGNRGMTLEEDINDTNDFYLATSKAVIHKKPTPVQIVKVDYPSRSAAVIKEAYFKQPSTTDYNGVFNGKYIDFEAKETSNKTSFPLNNIHEHQIIHMKQVTAQQGLSFLIIRFTYHNETYFFPAERLFYHWEQKENGGRKSISYENVKEEGILIPIQYQARVDYLSAVNQYYV